MERLWNHKSNPTVVADFFEAEVDRDPSPPAFDENFTLLEKIARMIFCFQTGTTFGTMRIPLIFSCLDKRKRKEMRLLTTLFVLATCCFTSSVAYAQQPEKKAVFFPLKSISVDLLEGEIWNVMRNVKTDKMFVHPDKKLGGVWIKSTPTALARVKKIIAFCDRELKEGEKIKVYRVDIALRKKLINSLDRTFKNSKSFDSETNIDGCMIIKGNKFEHDVFREIHELNSQLATPRQKR